MLQLNETSLEQFNKISENIYGNIFLFSYNLYHNDENLLYLLYSDAYTDLSSIKFGLLSNKLSSYSNLIHSYEIINLEADFVCSNFSTYTTTESFYDQDIITYLNNSTPSSSPVLLMPRTIAKYTNGWDKNTESEQVLSIIFYGNKAGAFVINIDQTTALTIFDSATDSGFVENLIVSQTGYLLSSSENYAFGSNMKNNKVYQEIMHLNQNAGTITKAIEGQSYYISYYRSSALGLVFIKMTRNLLLDTNNSLLIKSFSYSVIFIVVSLFVCFIFSFRLYRPIKNLTSDLSHYSKATSSSRDEFAEISQTYKDMYHENRHLQKKMTNYKNAGRARAVKELLDSSFASITPTRNNLEDFDLVLDGPNYLALLIGIDPTSEEEWSYQEDSSLLLYSIYNIITELMSSYLTLECVDLNSTQLVCLLNISVPLDAQYLADLKQAQNAMKEYFNVSFSCGIGNVVNDLEGIKESYHKASIAFKHRIVMGYNKIISYENLEFIKESDQIYPYYLEKELLNSIKTMQSTLMEECVKNFFNSICRYHYNQIILYTLQLNFALKQFALQYDLETDDLFESTDYNFQNNVTFDQITTRFISCSESMIQSLTEIRAHKSDKTSVIQNVIAFIETNIYNPNLTVEMIAEEVSLSVNYLRNIFKENTNQSLSGFIIEKKLELICHLLIDTNMPIQELSEKVGFTTKNYFFTFFKKHMEVTPNQYRKENQNDSTKNN